MQEESIKIPIGYYVHHPWTEITFVEEVYTKPTPEEIESKKKENVMFIWLH